MLACYVIDPSMPSGEANPKTESKSVIKKSKKNTSKKIFLDKDIENLPTITLKDSEALSSVGCDEAPVPVCHNIVSTSQIITSMKEIDLQRLASLFPFTSYDRKRFAAITIRLANPHCTCLLFGSGKLVITGSTSFHACIVASQTITEMLREVNLRFSLHTMRLGMLI
jgi:transcription initiation factor TFIID TATA-box-binding protein